MTSNYSYAPIVMFVYNRPMHTKKTIEALQKNDLAQQSELFVYADGAKDEQTIEDVNKVREYISLIDGFKQVRIIERDKNWGLAKSIIDGVTSVVNRYGKIIVLEDDLVTSRFFLKYMNEALEFYQNEEKVMHISGWNYPLSFETSADVYLYRAMNCWGWGTWKNSWSFFRRDTNYLINKHLIAGYKRFNLDGSTDVWIQLILNKIKIIDTWAIYWYASIFANNGLCLNPVVSYVQNIGFDRSGVHHRNSSYQDNIELNQKSNITFTDKIAEDQSAVNTIKLYCRSNKKSIVTKIFKRMIRLISANG